MSTAEQVDALMLALEEAYGDVVKTPGGVSWLHTHHVPVRRLLTRAVKRLAIGEPVTGGTNDEMVVASHDPSLGYVTYDISDAGMAYLLGRSALGAPEDTEERLPIWEEVDQPGRPLVQTPVCAVSWSSRHAGTMLPVLVDLADRGITSTLLDLATDAGHFSPEPSHVGVTVVRMPQDVITADGGVPTRVLDGMSGGHAVQVGQHQISLHRLAVLALRVLMHSADCTQPSWAAAVRIEKWLDRALAGLGSAVFLCSNDTSPPGVIAVRAAERAGADTVYVQHGAWVDGHVAWRAQHCRHIAVMGARDVVTAHTWTRRADARAYVVGQPRFDALVQVDRARQRLYLEQVLSDQAGTVPPRVLVWACQPFREQRLLSQFQVITEGLRRAGDEWGLVIAPHPVQGADAFGPLLESADDLNLALADLDVGARGCLAGADALISASSTCGIEAVLVDVPVLELNLPATRTLGLADQRAAQRCSSGQEIATALGRIAEAPGAVRVTTTAKRAICLEPGRSAAAVADIVVKALHEHAATQGGSDDHARPTRCGGAQEGSNR